jgi:hypothetical protein
MGTRRSKHNKGVKPRYKELGRESIRFTFDDEKPSHKKARQAPPWWVSTAVPGVWRTARRETCAQPELADAVAAYLEKRRAQNARVAAAQVFPTPLKSAEHRLIDGGVFHPHLADDNPNLVQTSERDVLMQLFVERKISAGQLHAGRQWQRIREQATLQPNASVLARAWSRPYQVRGNISDRQAEAMEYRRDFCCYAGPAALASLDFCLDADRGTDELTRLLNVGLDQLTTIIDDLLSKLCANKSAQRSAT